MGVDAQKAGVRHRWAAVVLALAVVATLLPDAGGAATPAAAGGTEGGCNVPRATASEEGGGATVAGEADGVTVERLAGADRVGTAVAVSQASFERAGVVVLARAGDYADALAGAPLARQLAGPLLLTPGGGLDERVAGELDRLGAERVVLLGGTAAPSPQVAADAREQGLEVERVAGADRFATAAAVAGELDAPDTVYVAEGAHADPGRGWPDALAAAALAAQARAPVLLATRGRLPTATAAALERAEVGEAVIVGGSAAVSEAVAAAVGEAADAGVRRLAGADRFATAAAAAEEAIARGATPSGRWLATGAAFPDALAAGPAVAHGPHPAVAAAAGETLLLAPGGDLATSPALVDALRSYRGELRRVVVLGGPAAISQQAEAQLADLLGEHTPDPASDAPSHTPSVSADGRHIAFASQARNLVEEPAGGAAQVFVRDRATGDTELISAVGGEAADVDAGEPAVSADGRYVAFTSAASNLSETTGAHRDVYLADRETGEITLISRAADGGGADGPSREPAISSGGRYVAFTSQASNLTGAASADGSDVYLADRDTGEIALVSRAAAGGPADGSSGEPAISGDGQLVAFVSQAGDLTAGSAEAHPEVYLRHRENGTTERLSAIGGAEPDGPSRAPSVSPSGRYVAFDTAAPALVEAAGGAEADTHHVVRLDRTTGRTRVVTATADEPNYTPAVADNGRVAFTSRANLSSVWPATDHEQVYEWRPDEDEIFQLSVDDEHGAQADAHSRTAAISGNGAVVAFATPATSLVPTATGGTPQVYAHTWVGERCKAVLASSAAAAGLGHPQPPADDEDRCEDRTTQPLVERAGEVHNVLHPVARDRRTTAAVRARHHTGRCVYVFGGGKTENLRPEQIDVLRSPREEAAEPKQEDAEITALEHVRSRGWRPLALGASRDICPACRDYIETTVFHADGEETTGTVVGDREAVWP